MPSPFPGMDPFIEGYLWHDFHGSLIFAIRDMLVPYVRPRYVVRTEERVYLEQEAEDGQSRHIRPDLLIGEPFSLPSRSPGRPSASLTVEPVEITLPLAEPVRERYLTIRERETLDVITVIELLSPANKRAGSSDRTVYLSKRLEVLNSNANLVELDLLRGGKRLPAEEPLPPGDYYAVISRSDDRPRAAAYPWLLRGRMPLIPIPLAGGDPDVPLDLQAAFTMAYDRAGYDYSLDYEGEIVPPLPASDLAWAQDILRSRTPAAP